MRENALQAKCLEWVRSEFGGSLLAVNNHGGGATNKGFPDLAVYGRGKCAMFELKGSSGYGLQPDQRVWRARFQACGTPYYVVKDDFEEFKRIVRKEFGS